MPSLDEVVGATKQAPTAEYDLYYLDGVVRPDADSDYFRLYPASGAHRVYYLIRKADVAGDLVAWTKEQLMRVGAVGEEQRYRVPLQGSAEILKVQVTCSRVRALPEGSPHLARDFLQAA